MIKVVRRGANSVVRYDEQLRKIDECKCLICCGYKVLNLDEDYVGMCIVSCSMYRKLPFVCRIEWNRCHGLVR